MARAMLALGASALLGCIYIPPEEAPPEVSRLATATVDQEGRVIPAEALTLEFPEGALESGERVTVTVDRVEGAPAGYVGEVYLVSPADRSFLAPVLVRYRYSADDISGVAEPADLYIGRASGSAWVALEEGEVDAGERSVRGQTAVLGVFGLVDPGSQG